LNISEYKEKEMDFRKKLKSEINKSRENLKNIIDELYEDGNIRKINDVRRVIDELDLFYTEISLAKTGQTSEVFSDRTPIDAEAIQRVIHFNKFILEKIENVTISCEEIADMMIDDFELDLSREVKKIKQYVTKARNQYKKRNDMLKEMK